MPRTPIPPNQRTMSVAKPAKRVAKKTENRRGSPEAVEKRRVARQFNTFLTGGSVAPSLDGRTEKRRARLLKELKDGKATGGAALKPLDVLIRVQELIGLGETMGNLRKVVKTKFPARDDEEFTTVLARLHQAYEFSPEAYRVVGLSAAALEGAGIVEASAKPRRRKNAAKA